MNFKKTLSSAFLLFSCGVFATPSATFRRIEAEAKKQKSFSFVVNHDTPLLDKIQALIRKKQNEGKTLTALDKVLVLTRKIPLKEKSTRKITGYEISYTSPSIEGSPKDAAYKTLIEDIQKIDAHALSRVVSEVANAVNENTSLERGVDEEACDAAISRVEETLSGRLEVSLMASGLRRKKELCHGINYLSKADHSSALMQKGLVLFKSIQEPQGWVRVPTRSHSALVKKKVEFAPGHQATFWAEKLKDGSNTYWVSE